MVNFIKTALKITLEAMFRYGLFMLSLWMTCQIINSVYNRGLYISEETAVIMAIAAVLYTAINKGINTIWNKAQAIKTQKD